MVSFCMAFFLPKALIWHKCTIMKFHEQARSYGVTLSAAKGLARGAQRCFASLSMTTPYRSWVLHFIMYAMGIDLMGLSGFYLSSSLRHGTLSAVRHIATSRVN